jgi:hypothetical protein
MKIDQPYVLSGSIEVSELVINSRFECKPNANLKIKAKRIRVNAGGLFLCGTAEAPFEGRLEITLFGNKKTASLSGDEERAFEVLDGGALMLHGSPGVSWTELDKTLNPGDKTIELITSPLGWKVLLLILYIEINLSLAGR